MNFSYYGNTIYLIIIIKSSRHQQNEILQVDLSHF